MGFLVTKKELQPLTKLNNTGEQKSPVMFDRVRGKPTKKIKAMSFLFVLAF